MARTNTGVKFFLKTPKADQSSIKCVFCYNGSQLYYYERKLSVPTKFWNKNSQRVKETIAFKEHGRINESLEAIEAITIDAYRRFKNEKGREPEHEELKSIIKERRGVSPIPENKPIELMDFIRTFIEDAKAGKHVNHNTSKPVKDVTIRTYQQTHKLLEVYSKAKRKKLDFDQINTAFHKDFVHFLTHEYRSAETEKPFKPNTVGKHITNLKTFMNNAFEMKLTTNQDFKLKGFRVPSENVDKIYLNKEELTALTELDLSNNKRLEKARDSFILGCHTGLRISDLKRLSQEHIIEYKGEKIIQIEMRKTEKPVRIPINEEVKKIIKKYKADTGLLFPKFMSDQKCNDYIKEAAAMVEVLNKPIAMNTTESGKRIEIKIPKSQLITNHTARRSFATNLALEGAPFHAIMQLTGHKTEKAFLRYIKINGYDAIDLILNKRRSEGQS